MNLIKYDAACYALAQCKRVDEVKSWADKAAAMQAYGRMAKDKTLEVDAAEIRIRAERKLGELITKQKNGEGLAKSGPKNNSVVGDDRIIKQQPTLAEAGIGKDLSARAQKIAAVPEQEFEQEVIDWRGRVKAEGARVSARLESAGAKNLKEKENDRQETAEDFEADLQGRIDNLIERNTLLLAENQKLKDRLLVEAQPLGEEAKVDLQNRFDEFDLHVADLEDRLRKTQIELDVCASQRDHYMNENAQMKRQILMMRKEAGKK